MHTYFTHRHLPWNENVHLFLQLTLQAMSRTRSAFATVRVLITRQIDQKPFFVSTPYRRSIINDQIINQTILSVTARDNDLAVSVKCLLNHHFVAFNDFEDCFWFALCWLAEKRFTEFWITNFTKAVTYISYLFNVRFYSSKPSNSTLKSSFAAVFSWTLFPYFLNQVKKQSDLCTSIAKPFTSCVDLFYFN